MLGVWRAHDLAVSRLDGQDMGLQVEGTIEILKYEEDRLDCAFFVGVEKRRDR